MVKSFMTLALALAFTGQAHATPPGGKRVALTFDDAPRGEGPVLSGAQRTDALLRALRGSTAPAAFFVTTQGFDSSVDGKSRVERYAGAGHFIANHSHTHPWAHKTDVDRYLADIDTAEARLEGIPNRRPWFRFPFLDQGREAGKRARLLAGLSKRGLRSGYVTIDTYDWHIDSRWKEAVKAGQTVDRNAVKAVYVAMLVEAAEHYAQMSTRWLGRQPAHVILLHENDAAALFLPDAIAALQKAGWTLISPEEAYRDPIASLVPVTDFSGKGHVAALAFDKGARGAEALDHWSSTRAAIDAKLSEAKAFSSAP
ncbi:MAG: polysaccharide deacetylase family protein [Myxococcota bacterium]